MCLVGHFFVHCTLDIYQFSPRFSQIQDQLNQLCDQLDQLVAFDRAGLVVRSTSPTLGDSDTSARYLCLQVTPPNPNRHQTEVMMNNKRELYVHSRVTRQEMRVIDALARHMRRTRSDTMRVLALEKAEELGLEPDPVTIDNYNIEDMV